MRTTAGFPLIFRHALFCRAVTTMVIVAFTMLITEPLAAALHAESHGHQQERVRAPTQGELLAASLREAREVLRSAERGVGRGRAIAAERRALADLRRQIAALDQGILREFDEIETRLQVRGVPGEIVARHHETVAAYREEMGSLLEDLTGIETIEAESELRDRIERAERRLSARQMERSQHPFDPEQLPHGPQRPNPDNIPREGRDGFLGAGLLDNPLAQWAGLEGYTYDLLPGADDPAYLDETIEIRLSPAIRAKAEELNHQPVEIYHWVRNNVEWLPTWGAVQDSDLTLSARRGNAMDIAGLLVALLRASDVPARYVHGTIEVPEERFRNWVGGFESIEEAMNYAASGGIPVTGLIQGGRVTQVRMEHVWVEAAIDFLPSRGAVMRSADTWLALDASFKQYEFLEGLDVAAIAGIDAQALTDSFLQSGAVNESEGWVQGLDPTLLESAQEDARQALEAYIEQMHEPTVGEVIGGRKVIVREEPILPSGLPYPRAVEGVRYAALPQALQPRISFGLGADILGDPLAQTSFPWAQVNNARITLSFRPATQADEDALIALLPEGEITDISQLPSSIPAYLIQVVPELKVAGETVLTGARMRLGEELAFRYSVRDPVHGLRHYPNKVVAGSYLAVGVIGGRRRRSKVIDLLRLSSSKPTKTSDGRTKMFAYDRPLLAACRQLQAMTMIVGPRQACARERSQAYRAARRTRKSLRHLVACRTVGLVAGRVGRV